MRASVVLSMYIHKLWEQCTNAETANLTEKYSEIIDNLYDVLARVSKYERSLLADLSVD